MEYGNLRRQAASLKKSLFDQGYLDEQFCQVEDLQDEANPNFAEEVVSLFFKDSARVMLNFEQAIEKHPKDFARWDAHMQQLKGSCSSIGASRVKNECTSFRNFCGEENAEGLAATAAVAVVNGCRLQLVSTAAAAVAVATRASNRPDHYGKTNKLHEILPESEEGACRPQAEVRVLLPAVATSWSCWDRD
ncbi:hypothetical protein OsI_22286 [Oryza sativa Indica Group]|uniref:Histidine-containing phosphotransfer protein n=1 Tax=Oryza sativa subsp. indica TaxID=39946 RepID=B8B4B1_ORYSI|nr:hypothetical protein OsI_22286 [Oryza sativa Indica Group]